MATLELSVRVAAPRDAVFRALTDPDELAAWWGPEGFSVPRVDYRPNVGSTYRIEMQPPEGDAFHLTGEFREVDPPDRLSYTFVWEPPDPDDVETLVVLELSEADGGTEVRMTQGTFKTEARRDLHRDGWSESFAKLGRFLTLRG